MTLAGVRWSTQESLVATEALLIGMPAKPAGHTTWGDKGQSGTAAFGPLQRRRKQGEAPAFLPIGSPRTRKAAAEAEESKRHG
jgi:hypothetical protein